MKPHSTDMVLVTSPDAFSPPMVHRELARRDAIADGIAALPDAEQALAQQAEAERQRLGAVQGGACAEMAKHHSPWTCLGTRRSRLARKRHRKEQALASREMGTAQLEGRFGSPGAIA